MRRGHRLSVGLGIFTGQVPPGSGISVSDEYRFIVSMAEHAERLGFDSIWLSEHHGAEDAYLPSLLAVLAAMSSVTERIGLGTAVLLPALHHPLRLAEDVAVLDQLSRGRVLLGLGLGWREPEFRAFGIPRAERAGRTAEIVALLRQAWRGDAAPFNGRYYRFDELMVRPLPFTAGGPPIYMAGSQEAPIRRAAAMADGLIYSRTGPTAAQVQPDFSHLHAALDWVAEERAGNDGEFPLILLLNVFVGDGDPWAVVGAGVDYQFAAYARWKGEDERAAAVAGRKLVLSGNPVTVTSALCRWIDAIIARRSLHLMVKLHYPGVPAARSLTATELFAREVMPALRSHAMRAEAAIAGR